MGISIRRAGVDDVDLLTAQRRGMFVDIGQDDTALLDRMEEAFRPYAVEALSGGGLVAWIAEVDGLPAGGLAVVEYLLPPSCRNISGRVAYALNMFVDPAYRRRGVATALIGEAIRSTRESGCELLSLHASVHGRPLYERLGFRDAPEMRLFLGE